MKTMKLFIGVLIAICASSVLSEESAVIRVAGWPMSNSSHITDPSKRSDLYAALGQQGVDFVYICNGKANDVFADDTYGFVKCQTSLQSVSYGQMVLGYDSGRYTLLASTDTKTTGGESYLYSNAFVTQGLYLENNTTKEKMFFMAFAGLNADFAKPTYKNWFSWIMSDIAVNYPCEKIIFIFPISKSREGMRLYLTDTVGLEEIYYNKDVTDFAVFASPGQFVLSSAQSVTESKVSTAAEGIIAVTHTPKCTVKFVDYDGTVIKSQSVVSGGNVTPPEDPQRSGFDFMGWDHPDSAFEGVTTGFTVVAQYAAKGNSHTVRFLDEDGVTVLGEFAVEDGMAAVPPVQQPEHEGKHFVGWMLNGAAYDISAAVTSDIVLVALYVANVYNVTFFDWNGIQLGGVQQIRHGSSAVAPELPSLPEGKIFWKWDNDFSSVTNELTATAVIVDTESEIGSYEQFAAMIVADGPVGALYRLTADMNLSQWKPVDFSGVLDGCGHKIEGLSTPLFNTISAGRVQNLMIGASTVVSSVDGEAIGFVARELDLGSCVSNCTIDADCLIRANKNVQCGAIVGKIVKGSEVVGVDISGIFDCTNHALIDKATGDANTSAGGCGGIVGHVTVSLPNEQSSFTCRIERCYNDGLVSSTKTACNLGGIIGYATVNNGAELMIARCVNTGAIFNSSKDASTSYVTTHAGGIIGYVGGPYDGSIVISDCVNRGEVSSGYEPADSEIIRKCAGGIVAKVESLNKYAVFLVENTANCGRISGHSAAGLISRVGANVNYAYTAVVISNVANYAAVEGVAVVAQAIGKITVPDVKYDRRIANAFFETSSNSGVALFGDESTAEAFAVENVIDSNAKGAGYSATGDRDALNAFAASNNLEPWTLSRLADKTVVPMLSRFCEKEYFPGFVIRVK